MDVLNMSLSPQVENGGTPVPVHVAIIMDGNGRWAAARGLPRTEGHRKGAESTRAVIKSASKIGVKYLTLFGFSSENWKRPSGEVLDLMGLLRLYLKKEMASLHKQGIRFRVIGERSRLPDDIQDLINDSEKKTFENKGMTLVIALSYGGRSEIVKAARLLAEQVQEGTLTAQDIDEDLFLTKLETIDIPDPDLLIRTSGEQRISNFMLWQCAYTEFVFTETLWPDFKTEAFEQSVLEYRSRERRYGALCVR